MHYCGKVELEWNDQHVFRSTYIHLAKPKVLVYSLPNIYIKSFENDI